MLSCRSTKAVTKGAAALALFALSACASSEVSGIKVASQDQINNIRVSSISVKIETPKPNDSLRGAMEKQLEEAMPLCATGAVDHRLDVTVTEFEDQDVGKAIFLGDEIELKGSAEFVDLTTNEQTGAYFLENSFSWGGFIGAAMMSDAEISLSKDFAKNLCKEVFGVSLSDSSKS